MNEDDFIEDFEEIMSWFGYDDMFPTDDFSAILTFSYKIAALVERYEYEL